MPSRFRLVMELEGKTHETWVDLDPEAVRALKPLHPDHDLSGLAGVEARMEAIKQRGHRSMIAQSIGKEFVRSIIAMVEEQDPKNGYTPAQNAAFYKGGGA